MAKNIKIILFLITGLLLYHPLLYAQSSLQGIYLSGNDFNDNKISYAPLPGKKYRLHLNELFDQPAIKIIVGDSAFTLNKDAVFGYRDNENTIHRFYKKIDYKILNPGETILLYSYTFPGGYKNLQTIEAYYFSAGANAALLPLTKWDLKKAFSNDPAFHELLDMYFVHDKDLLNYDSFYKMYKLNRVFQFAQQMILKNK